MSELILPGQLTLPWKRGDREGNIRLWTPSTFPRENLKEGKYVGMISSQQGIRGEQTLADIESCIPPPEGNSFPLLGTIDFISQSASALMLATYFTKYRWRNHSTPFDVINHSALVGESYAFGLSLVDLIERYDPLHLSDMVVTHFQHDTELNPYDGKFNRYLCSVSAEGYNHLELE